MPVELFFRDNRWRREVYDWFCGRGVPFSERRKGFGLGSEPEDAALLYICGGEDS